MAGASLSLERRPVVAGVFLGSLVYKPHFLVMVPLALIAGRLWVTTVAAACTAIGLCAVSLAVFGVASWQAFLSDLPLAREALERGLVGDEKMQSVFGAVRRFGGTVESAYIAQIAIALMAGGVLIYLCRVVPTRDKLGAAIVVATLLATPFLLPYDLVLTFLSPSSG